MVKDKTKRKLVAVVHADVKGYSRLIGEDDEYTVKTLASHRKEMYRLVKIHKGHVRDTAGDGFLVEFPSVVDAVKFSVEFQREMKKRNADIPEDRKMEFRVGVNIGDVIHDGGTIHGDGVNIAARLEGLAEPGGICISGAAYEQVKKRLDLEYEYIGAKIVKNIAEPVPTYKVLIELREAAVHKKKPPRAKGAPWQKTYLVAAAVIVAAIASVAIWYLYFQSVPPPEKIALEKAPALPLPDKPSIAVLPFDNLSADDKYDFLVDGMTEDIITSLARFDQLFVIARNSSFTYKNKRVKVQKVAEDLRVRYVLEGTVQISGSRIRVTAQLIDANTGRHEWVERYDRELKDTFEVQDAVARKLVGSLVGKLDHVTTAMALLKHPDSLDAYGLFLRGTKLFWHFTREDNAKSRELLEKAVDLEPAYASAHAMLALTHWADWQWYAPPTPKASYRKALELARKAVSLDPRDASARLALGYVLLYDNKHDEAIAQFEEGLKVNPNNADLLAASADPYVFNGQPQEAIKRVKEAMRLNPYYPNLYLFQLGIAQYVARDYEGAIKTIRKMSPLGEPRRIVAACLAYLGRTHEAQVEAHRFLQDNPTFSASQWSGTQPFRYEKDRHHAVQGYIKAGLPEHPPLSLPHKPSIAVLPFVNMSGDPKQEYFSDGITEEIITGLSKIPELFVIASNSSFVFKGKRVDVKEVGRKLGVRYVLEGSVGKQGDRVRITAQLIDAQTRGHVWSERYDREMKDIFIIQDEIRQKIMIAMRMKLIMGEQVRLWVKEISTSNMEAYETFLRAVWFTRQDTKDALTMARQLSEEAIKLDPNFAGPYVTLAICHLVDGWAGWSTDPEASFRNAGEMALKARALNKSLDSPYSILGLLYCFMRKYDKAIEEGRRAIALNPNGADAHFWFGIILYYAGEYQEAIVVLERAMRLNPMPGGMYYANLGIAYNNNQQYDKAISILKKGLQRFPDYSQIHAVLVLSYGQTGRWSEARKAAEEYMRSNPNYSLVQYKMPYKDRTLVKKKREIWRKAGLK